MEAKTALLIAVGLAFGLPYLTVALLQGGDLGMFAVGALFLLVFAVVIISDLRGGDSPPESGSGEE